MGILKKIKLSDGREGIFIDSNDIEKEINANKEMVEAIINFSINQKAVSNQYIKILDDTYSVIAALQLKQLEEQISDNIREDLRDG